LRQPGHAGKADGDSGAVARGTLDRFEGQFEDEFRLDRCRAEFLDGVAANEGVYFADLFVGESG
jgi:hypothetical protein